MVRFLRNLALGTDNGPQLVREATTDQLRQILPDIGEYVRWGCGDAAAVRNQQDIAEIWPGYV